MDLFERLPWTRSGSCRCQGCGGPERTYKYLGLFSVQIKDEDEEYTVDLCTKCFLAGGRQQSATARQTSGTNVTSRSLHGIIVEVIRTFQQESVREKRLLVKTAEALV